MTLPVAVVGAGPLGAATALALTRRSVGEVLLVDGGDATAGWRNSGGSISWHRPDPVKADLIRRTADAITARVEAGAPIRVRSTPYLILKQGVLVPALNVSSGDVVADLTEQAEVGGAVRVDIGRVHALTRHRAGWTVVGEQGAIDAGVVLLATGTGNLDLMPGLPRRLEKRQLFVLDLPVDDGRARLPHIVARIGPAAPTPSSRSSTTACASSSGRRACSPTTTSQAPPTTGPSCSRPASPTPSRSSLPRTLSASSGAWTGRTSCRTSPLFPSYRRC
jgi:glycine/D-amino acid oxidase-like deaminating enzyme